MADETPRGPVFIVGSMGSGTTLLRLILDSHENLAIAQETTFMRAALAHRWIPFWITGGEWYGRIGLSDQQLDEELRTFYDGLFGRFAREQGATRWGDKSPHHMWHMREALEIFPDAVFVATVRHPGAVASSQHHRFRWYWDHAVSHWRRNYMELAHRASDLGDRLLIVRYEDVVLKPEETLRQLLAAIGEPWSDSVIEHHVVQGERGTQMVEGKTRATDPIDVSRVTKWSQNVNEAGERLIKSTAPLANFYGYDVENPGEFGPIGPKNDPEKLVITGTDLAARRADFPDINWDFKPTPSLPNQMLKPSEMTVVEKQRKTRVPKSQVGQAGVSPNRRKRKKKGGGGKGAGQYPNRAGQNKGKGKGQANKRTRAPQLAASPQPKTGVQKVMLAVWRRLPAKTQDQVREFGRTL